MRRFISYLALTIGAVTLCGVSFASLMSKAQTNLEYNSGKTIVYQLSNEEDILTDKDLNQVVSIMEDRLTEYGITSYKITTEGSDMVRVSAKQNNLSEYYYLADYLGFNGSLAIGTKTDVMTEMDNVKNGTAYLDFRNSYPTVVLPVKKDSPQWKEITAEAQKLKEEAGAEERSEGEEEEVVYVYVMGNFNAGEDLISQCVEGTSDYDESKQKKLVMSFPFTDAFYFNDDKTAIAASLNLDTDGDGNYTSTDMHNATMNAKYLVSLLNAEELPCEVTYMYDYNIDPVYENLLSYNGVSLTPAMSGVLISTLLGIIFIALILGLFFKWAAFGICAASIVSVFGALGFTILFSTQITLACIIGLIAVGIISLASGCLYITRVREECYRGRSLRKANAEGYKKALVPIVDFHVIAIIVGAICFGLGGASLVPMASALVFGGLVSLLCNTIGMKALFWLLTNTTKFINRYDVIGCDSKKIPDVLKEEKQSFYGAFADKNVNKHSKVSAIILTVLGVASICGVSIFGAINNSNFYNHGTDAPLSYVYFETTSDAGFYDTVHVEDLLKKVTVSTDGGKTYQALSVAKVEAFERDNVVEKDDDGNNVTNNYKYTVAKVNGYYTEDDLAKYTSGQYVIEDTVSGIFEDIISYETGDSKAIGYMRGSTTIDKSEPVSWKICLCSAIALAVICVYFALRFGLSRALAALGIGALVSIIPLGFFALTRIVTVEAVSFALPFTLIVTLLSMVFFFSKDKEIHKEDFVRSKDNSSAKRDEMAIRASRISFGVLLLVGSLAIYLALVFMGIAGSKNSSIGVYAAMLIGTICSLYFVGVCLAPISQAIFRVLERRGIKMRAPRKKHKNKVVKKNGDEPEEAIFFGIND